MDLRGVKFGYLLRHGETDMNEKGMPRALSDVPLNRKGMSQAYAAAQKLKDKKVTSIRSGTSERIRHTAKIVSKTLGIAPEYTEKLNTLDIGDLAKLPEELADRKILDYYLNKPDTPMPGGTSVNSWLGEIWPELEYFFLLIDQGKHPLDVSVGRISQVIHALVIGGCKVLAQEVFEAKDYLQKPGELFVLVQNGKEYNFHKV